MIRQRIIIYAQHLTELSELSVRSKYQMKSNHFDTKQTPLASFSERVLCTRISVSHQSHYMRNLRKLIGLNAEELSALTH